jgi:hypothetical protein
MRSNVKAALCSDKHGVCYTLCMSTDIRYPPDVPYRTPRPRAEDGSAGTIAFGILGWLLTANPLGALAGGALGNSLVTQPKPLEAAVRAYFTQRNLPLIAFYRLGPKAAKVLFTYLNQFWTVTSHAPESSSWSDETLEDWLYGDIVQNLEMKLSEIKHRLAS